MRTSPISLLSGVRIVDSVFCRTNDFYFDITGTDPDSVPVWDFIYPGDATGGIGGMGLPWNNQISSFECADVR